MKTLAIAISLAVACFSLSGCLAEVHSEEHTKGHSQENEHAKDASHSESHDQAGHHSARKIVVTSPIRKDMVSTQPYVCQIHSCNHIEVRALKRGYLEEICVKEGQAVKKGELMFQILPVLYKATLKSEIAERDRIQIELNNAQTLRDKGIVSPQEIALKKTELDKAKAKVALAEAELDFASIRAPFDGIVDRQRNQIGSLIEEGDVLTTFSDNSTMWVYFNVPEKRYLQYKAEIEASNGQASHLKIELKLANGTIFNQPGKIGAIEADFNNTNGNIAFRADFPNPNGLLRNGQTGTILMHNVMKDIVVIPQRATFPILDKLYAYVVDEKGVVHQRDITVQGVQDDVFMISKGLDKGDKIILEGIPQVTDGQKIEYEFRSPEIVLSQLKYHAE
ncbi:MAG: efflux RND transporter periplasmic adaptor subunit [Planctomycetales bacterium]